MPSPLAEEAVIALEVAARRARPSVHLLSVSEARQVFEQESRDACRDTRLLACDLERVGDVVTDSGLRVRLYRPAGDQLPAVVFFHGGGFVLGSVDTHDLMCRELAAQSGCAVLSVNYRLAPEHPFPAAVDDAQEAWTWLVDHGSDHDLDPTRVAVCGDSAGGNIAVALALQTAGSTVQPLLQVLFYPVTTTNLTVGFDASYDGLVLCLDELLWHQAHYLPREADRRTPLASPMDCADLHEMPAALVIAAACDPIAPQSHRYAAALQAAGVPAEVQEFAGMIHGFAQFPIQFKAAREALSMAAGTLRSALHPRAGASGFTVH